MFAAALLLSLVVASPADAAAPVAPTVPDDPDAAAVLGPLPPGTTFDRTERHPEFLRFHVRTDRAFVVEVTPSRGGAPICSGGGVDLWVRLDLAGASESFVWDPLPAIVTQACGRLAAHPPTFPPRASTPAPPDVTDGDPPPWEERLAWRPRPLHAVVVPFLVLLLLAIPRDRAALGAGLVALVVRVALTRPTVLLGGDAAYERLLRARGAWDPDPYYGEAWPAIMGLAWRALGLPDHHVHAVNIGFSALTVAFVVALARRMGVDRIGATAGGLMLALHPLAVAVAGMEDVFVLVGLLQVVAFTCALGPSGTPSPSSPSSASSASGLPRAVEPWLAALAVGLLAHLRPEQGAFAVVPLALLARRRAWGPFALGLGLATARWAELLAAPRALGHGADLLGWARWTDGGFLRALGAPLPGNPVVLLDPTRSPVAFAALAIVGAVALARAARSPAPPTSAGPSIPDRSPRDRWHVAALFAALLVPLAVVVTKTTPLADPLRFQLPTLAFAAVLAGAGLARFADRRAALVAWGGGLALTTVLARAPLDGGWAWAEEYTFLRAHLDDAPVDTLVLYRPDQDVNHHFGTWVDAVSPGRWRPMGSAPATEGAWYWRGFADAVAATWPPMPCDLAPIAVTEVTSRTDGWIVLPTAPVTVGFYRIGVCDGAPAP